jgi:signal transduction histidine kinase
LDEFAYVASHDLKSPLRGIDQLASWIAEDIAAERFDDTQSHLQLMRNRVQRMERLLSDLLTYSQVGRRSESMALVDVNTLAEEIFALSSPPPGFQLKFANELPTFRTLSAPFEQILRNLIGNAIKHHGGESGTVTMGHTLGNDGSVYEFFVRDDGQGISPKYHDLVFKMFKSLKPRDEVEGSGIGLTLIRKMVTVYGGRVWLESEVGQGVTVYFTWPVEIESRE